MTATSSPSPADPAMPGISAKWRGRQFGFRTHLLGLVLACILPLSALSVLTIMRFGDAEQESQRASMLGTARVVSGSIDQQLRNRERILLALAETFPEEPAAMATFYEYCRAIGEQHGGWVLLADPTGKQVFNTKRPLGTELPPVAGTTTFWAAAIGRKTGISNLFTSTVDGQPMFAVEVPVIRDDQVRAVLALLFPARSLSDLLTAQKLPPDWTVAAVDAAGTIVARSRDPEQIVGVKASPEVVAMPEDQSETFLHLVSRSGVQVSMAVARSSLSHWKTTVFIPQVAVDAPLMQSLRHFVLLGLGALFVAGALASLIARHLSRNMRTLAHAARAIGRHDPMPAMQSTVHEVSSVARALGDAGAQLAARERELRRSQQHLAQAEHVAAMGSIVCDLATNHDEWSDEVYRILGIERGSRPATYESFMELVHPDDRAVLDVKRWVLLGGKPKPAQDYRIVRPDGTIRTVHREMELQFDDAGRPSQAIITLHDVTKLRDAEQRERELERQLLHAHKLEALGTLAGGIAHDLNNTLVPVLGLGKLTMKRLPEAGRERANLAVILQAGERARDLVRQILAFSRKEEATRQVVDLAELVRSSLKMLYAGLPSTIRIEERFTEVPPLLADPGQLHQVIINLVVNAAQAIGDEMGTITVTLDTKAEHPDGPDPRHAGRPLVHLAVRDTGCGMDEPTLRRIFEPFFTTKGVGEGTGLGLSVVHGIVARHGGTISATSVVGEGTCFDVYLPAAAAEEQQRRLEPAHAMA